MTIAADILNRFRGRADYVAVPNGPGFKPHKLDEPLRPEWLESEHLGGKRCLGFYLMTEASEVYCSAVDFDNKPDNPDPEWLDKAERLYYGLCQLGVQPLVEISQSGNAAHVWIFADEPVPAYVVRRFWYAVAAVNDVPLVEIYPRQDRLGGKGLGNLIRYPLWGQSRFVDIEHDLETIPPETCLADVKPVDATDLTLICSQLTGSKPHEDDDEPDTRGLTPRVAQAVDRPHTLLGRRWEGDMQGLNDKSRSALVLSIARELVRQYIPTAEIETAIRVWCAANGYEKGEREDWVETTVAKAYELLGQATTERTTTWTIEDAAREYVEEMRRGIPPHIGSGIWELDRSIDGVAAGEVCVIAARPSHGKTAFAMQWVDDAAGRGVPCLLISEEMSKRELGKRALLHISRMEAAEWGGQEDVLVDEIRRHYAGRAKVFGLESVQSIDAVERLIDEYVRTHGVKLVAVDYLQLLSSSHTARYDSVTDISRRLKQAATRNGVAMLVLCQLNREIEKREGHEPQQSDLRESGQIEQDADLILMLQWPVKYDNGIDASEYRIFCEKRRNGEIRQRVVKTKFDPTRQKFGISGEVFELPGDYASIVGSVS